MILQIHMKSVCRLILSKLLEAHQTPTISLNLTFFPHAVLIILSFKVDPEATKHQRISPYLCLHMKDIVAFA